MKILGLNKNLQSATININFSLLHEIGAGQAARLERKALFNPSKLEDPDEIRRDFMGQEVYGAGRAGIKNDGLLIFPWRPARRKGVIAWRRGGIVHRRC